MKPESILLDGHSLTPIDLLAIAGGAQVKLDQSGLDTMAAARKVLEQAIASRQPVYGVTTGLGPRVLDSMPDDSLDTFSLNTIRGRAHAVGEPLQLPWVRAGIAVRANSLLSGAAGARPALASHLVECLNAGLTPLIPETGTIGVADLAWGGALGLAMIGEGEMMMRDGCVTGSRQAMEIVGIEPFKPQPREGLALVSHSAVTAGMAAIGWTEMVSGLEATQTSSALTMEGFRANLSPLDLRVLALRPQPGQAEAAGGLLRRLKGSALLESGQARRLQDPLSIRNIVQVHGSVQATLDFTREAVMAELNGASDNPAVLVNQGEILSNGNYLPAHLSIALIASAQSLVQLAALQVARVGKLLFARFSGLSDGLSMAGAEGAGFSPLMKTAEALFSEIAQLASPPPIYPGISADGLEDVVTHSAIPAKSLFAITARLRQLAAIEAIVAVQAIELRGIETTLPSSLRFACAVVREVSSPLREDRPLGQEIDALAGRIRLGAFNA